MDYEKRWRETPVEDRLKFIADQVFDQSSSLIEIKTTLINHEGRLTRIESHKSGNPSNKGEQGTKRGNHNNLLFGISAAVAVAIAGAVTALKWVGWIK